MRVLFVTSDTPRFPATGAPTRDFKLISEVARQHQVRVLTFAYPGQEAFLEPLRRVTEEVVAVYPTPTGVTLTGNRLVRFLQGLVRIPPALLFHVMQYEAEAREHLLCMMQETDIVQFGGSHMMRLLSTRRRVRVVVDLHNVETGNIWSTMRFTPGPLARIRGVAAWWQMRRFESRVLAQADVCLATSAIEKRRVLRLAPTARVAIVPNGVDTDYLEPAVGPSEPARIVYTGSMDYAPNVDAVRYFARCILPRLRSVFPSLLFQVVGRGAGPELQALGREAGFEVTGEVPDVRPFLHAAQVVVVPLRCGAGTRHKILEAMATGKAIVSTRFGAEGIDVSPELDILLEDKPGRFADRVIALLRDASARESLGSAARATVLRQYGWPSIGQQLEEAYRTLR